MTEALTPRVFVTVIVPVILAVWLMDAVPLGLLLTEALAVVLPLTSPPAPGVMEALTRSVPAADRLPDGEPAPPADAATDGVAVRLPVKELLILLAPPLAGPGVALAVVVVLCACWLPSVQL